MRRLALLLVLFASLARAEDAFAPYLNDTPPQIVETLSAETKDGVEVRRYKFLNRVEPRSGQQVVIYGVLARPTTPGPHPAVLVCHGGGGYADMVAPQVIGWAKRGYVSACQDEPGIFTASKGSSTGPTIGKSPFAMIDRAEDSALYDGVLAALHSLALLRSQPDVDRARVGVTGGSWGGYMTTMVTGLAGNRVKAAFSVYGCGYYDLASVWQPDLNRLTPAQREAWLAQLDAGRRAKGLTATYMIAAPTNDWFFWPPAVMRTYADIPGAKNIAFEPNDSHALTQPGGTSGPPAFDAKENRTWLEQVWMEHELKGVGEPFPTAGEPQVVERLPQAVRVRFRASGPAPFKATSVCYAAGEQPWRLRWWATVPAEAKGGGVYEAVVPVTEPDQPLDWFGLVSDERNLTVSTLIATVVAGQGATGPGVGTFTQGFEAPAENRRWRRPYLERRTGTNRLIAEAAHTGRRGAELKGEATFGCFGFRAATLKRCGAKTITFWARAVDKPCPVPTVDLLTEGPDGRRCEWQWSTPEPLTTTWRQITVPLAELKPKGAAVGELLSPALGQVRFTTTPETWLYLDDVAIE